MGLLWEVLVNLGGLGTKGGRKLSEAVVGPAGKNMGGTKRGRAGDVVKRRENDLNGVEITRENVKKSSRRCKAKDRTKEGMKFKTAKLQRVEIMLKDDAFLSASETGENLIRGRTSHGCLGNLENNNWPLAALGLSVSVAFILLSLELMTVTESRNENGITGWGWGEVGLKIYPAFFGREWVDAEWTGKSLKKAIRIEPVTVGEGDENLSRGWKVIEGVNLAGIFVVGGPFALEAVTKENNALAFGSKEHEEIKIAGRI
jgi:hypothetical protein